MLKFAAFTAFISFPVNDTPREAFLRALDCLLVPCSCKHLTNNSDNRMWVLFVHKYAIMRQIGRDKYAISRLITVE